MKAEITKAFALKVALVSAGAAVAWHFVVGAQVNTVDELKVSLEHQAAEIQIGEDAIHEHADSVEASIKVMSEIGEAMAEQFDVHHHVNSHKFLQAAAENAGLTVLRVDPLGMSQKVTVNKLTNEKLVLETEEYRLECVGDYAGLVQFFETICTSENMAKVKTFRIVPVSAESTRAFMQISMYEISDAPKALVKVMASAISVSESGAGNGND